MAPPGGDNNMGVRKEMPSNPYLCQIRTNFLLWGEKTFLNLKNLINAEFFILSPKKLKIEMVVIIPAIVITVVINGCNPAAYPIVGPKTILSMHNTYIVK
jgi:hypothetical protein